MGNKERASAATENAWGKYQGGRIIARATFLHLFDLLQELLYTEHHWAEEQYSHFDLSRNSALTLRVWSVLVIRLLSPSRFSPGPGANCSVAWLRVSPGCVSIVGRHIPGRPLFPLPRETEEGNCALAPLWNLMSSSLIHYSTRGAIRPTHRDE